MELFHRQHPFNDTPVILRFQALFIRLYAQFPQPLFHRPCGDAQFCRYIGYSNEGFNLLPHEFVNIRAETVSAGQCGHFQKLEHEIHLELFPRAFFFRQYIRLVLIAYLGQYLNTFKELEASIRAERVH
jgi:hypothetical protein